MKKFEDIKKYVLEEAGYADDFAIDHPKLFDRIVKAAYNKGVTDSAESVQTIAGQLPGQSVMKVIVDKQSILKLLIP